MPTYVALLRGINLGKRQIKMAELRALLESQGYKDVRTLLASGNVVLNAKERDAASLRAKLEKAIKAKFGFDVPVLLRSEKEIVALVKANPFKGVKPDKNTRFYVTFLSTNSSIKASKEHKDHGIHAINKEYVASVLRADTGTPDHMDYLVKLFGANITTRNWNTVLKIHAAMQA